MHLTKNGSSLDSKLKKFVEKHDNLVFAVAWGSPGTPAVHRLIPNS